MAANNTLKSAGVSTREIDQTGQSDIQPVGVPPAVISPTQFGPGFVPITVPNMSKYVDNFGGPTENYRFGPLAANEWLTYQQSLMQLRVLGVGDGTQRASSGDNKGRVNTAGFIVGAQQPQSSLSGGLGNNAYANASSTGPAVFGPTGRTYFLATFMSESAGSTYFSDAGLVGGIPVVLRGVLMAPSGVVLTLSTSNILSTVPDASSSAVYPNIRGYHTGSVNLNSGKQEFVMLLNGHKGTGQYPNYITASFDMTAANYFGTIFNKDPLKVEECGHYLYSYFDIHPKMAVVTGSGYVLPASGSGAFGGYEKIALLLTSSLTYNSGSTTVPNYEGFEDRYETARSPWVISQKFGGSPVNLFKVWTLSDGDNSNSKVKISIENIVPSTTDANLYGTFDLLVRDYNDVDSNKVVLEPWRNLSLNEESDRYIAKVIGDYKLYFDLDAPEGKQTLREVGEYPNKSRYIRVEMSDALKQGEVDPSALPMGFRGNQHLVTSGSGPFVSVTDSFYYSSTNPFHDVVQLPVPMRSNLIKGAYPNQTIDKNLYWGVQFEQIASPTEPNSTNKQNSSLLSFQKYYPNFHTEYMNVVVRDNEGASDTAANGIVDADRFNNNMFSLEKVKIKYNSTTLLPDTSQFVSWSYVRSGNITTDGSALTRAMTVTDLEDSSTRAVAKFSFFLEGGFDGTRMFDKDSYCFTNKAVIEEMNSTSRGLSNGPTVKSYLKAIEIVKDVTELEIQLLVIPGIRHSYISDTAINAMEIDRVDAMYLMDIQERDTGNYVVTSTTQNASVKNTITDFNNRGLNSSYAAAYFPDVNIRDSYNRTIARVPPSVAVLGAFAKNDSVGYPWYAPAGFARASLKSVDSISVAISQQNMSDLAGAKINPLVTISTDGPVVWGQKTVLATTSAFERVNIRRLMIDLRRKIRKVSNTILFEQNRDTTLEKFAAKVNPILKNVQDQKGLEAFSVQINTSTTTQADIENKTIRGVIYVVPTKSLEFLSLDFVLTNQGSSIG